MLESIDAKLLSDDRLRELVQYAAADGSINACEIQEVLAHIKFLNEKIAAQDKTINGLMSPHDKRMVAEVFDRQHYPGLFFR